MSMRTQGNFLVDTNGLISFVTDRSPEQQNKIEPYFTRAAEGTCSIFVTGTTIAEFVYVLEKVYGRSAEEIASLLHAFLSTPGFNVVSAFDLIKVLNIWPGKITDYGDAVIAAVAEAYVYTILTFDRPFARQLQRQQIQYVIL
jgi:predicted nucleic acid-binding protein